VIARPSGDWSRCRPRDGDVALPRPTGSRDHRCRSIYACGHPVQKRWFITSLCPQALCARHAWCVVRIASDKKASSSRDRAEELDRQDYGVDVGRPYRSGLESISDMLAERSRIFGQWQSPPAPSLDAEPHQIGTRQRQSGAASRAIELAHNHDVPMRESTGRCSRDAAGPVWMTRARRCVRHKIIMEKRQTCRTPT